MDAKLLKSSHSVMTPRSQICQLQMENPQQLKLAKVTPIYENKGSAVITDQYRA